MKTNSVDWAKVLKVAVAVLSALLGALVESATSFIGNIF